MRMLMFGPPGVGKGTQSKLISKKLSIPQISTGDILRKAVKEESTLGKRAKLYLDEGKLVPDRLILEVIKEVLDQDFTRDCYILDGFPRTVDQAKGLTAMLEVLGKPLNHIIRIIVPDETILKRLVSRRICSNCGREYNLEFKPIPADGKCEACGNTEFLHRKDDQEETIRKRLSVYRNQTAPVIDYYRGQGLVTEVDGDRDIQVVNDEIMEIISKNN
jgi:adenylate kinase